MTAKHSVALLIRSVVIPDRVLLVQRPDDDEDLPGVWGLPATSLRGEENRNDAARRAAREKLGVDVELGDVLNEGSTLRPGYRLDMHLVEARIRHGEPTVDAPVPPGTTRYQAWRWGPLEALRPAAERGSLCSRLALEAGRG